MWLVGILVLLSIDGWQWWLLLWWWWCEGGKGNREWKGELGRVRGWCGCRLFWWWLLLRWWFVDLDFELDRDWDWQDREHECKWDREVRDLVFELERLLVLLMIGEREFRSEDDVDWLFLDLYRWMDDDLNLLLPLLFVVAVDFVVIKVVGDLLVGDIPLEL